MPVVLLQFKTINTKSLIRLSAEQELQVWSALSYTQATAFKRRSQNQLKYFYDNRQS